MFDLTFLLNGGLNHMMFLLRFLLAGREFSATMHFLTKTVGSHLKSSRKHFVHLNQVRLVTNPSWSIAQLVERPSRNPKMRVQIPLETTNFLLFQIFMYCMLRMSQISWFISQLPIYKCTFQKK